MINEESSRRGKPAAFDFVREGDDFWLDKAYRDGATTEDIVSKLLEWSKEDNGVVPDYVVEFI